MEFIEKVIDELSKNRRENDTCEEGGVIYATGGENCPVNSFKFYLDKLNPKINCLFQRPKQSPAVGGLWYDASPLGVKSIEKFMKKISIDANLSITYSNHSIRATSISVLDTAGFEARHIMSISGHKAESSIRSYSKTGLGTKRKMSENLSAFLNSKKIKPNFDFGMNFGVDQENSSESS